MSKDIGNKCVECLQDCQSCEIESEVDNEEKN